MPQPIRDYLATYGEPTARKILDSPCPALWRYLVVVPACGENENVQNLFRSLSFAAGTHRPHRSAVIVVVNTRDDHEPGIKKESRALIDWLGTFPKFQGSGFFASEVQRVAYSSSLDILFIDHTSPARPFPARQGVGLARKLGCDVGLALAEQGAWFGNWLHTTDADCEVGADYFQVEGATPNVVGLVHPYRHVQTDFDAWEIYCTELYEIYLRYYELGLKAAGSPYARPTIGSTLSFSADAYAKVRGFPKREAGEDFYLVDKLIKLGQVDVASRGAIRIAPRFSKRVPFGTGTGTLTISERLKQGRRFQLYAPAVFRELGNWIALMEAFAKAPNEGLIKTAESQWGSLWRELKASEAFDTAARTRKSPSDRRRHLHTWFDALKTLQCIHGLQRQSPDLDWEQALEQAPFIPSERLRLTSVPHCLETLRALTH